MAKKATLAAPPAADLVFADIPGYPGYLADNAGDVWSERQGERRRLKPKIDDRGRCFFTLTRRGERPREFRASRLVLLAFVGPCPVGMECCHGKKGGTVDSLDNVRWDTRLENCQDKIRQGTQPRGSKDGNASLDEERVAIIKRRLAAGETQVTLAAEFGITQGAISCIFREVTWLHVPWPAGGPPTRSQRRQVDTSCIHGHLMDAANTYKAKNGWKTCRECRKLATKARRAR